MRFSLLSLLSLVGGVSVYCGLMFATPVALSLIGLKLIGVCVPPVVVGGIIYGRDPWRAFWIVMWFRRNSRSLATRSRGMPGSAAMGR